MVAEELLSRARKVADEAEVYHLSHRDEPVIFEANRVKLVERRETSGVSLRVIKAGRVGFSSTTNLHDLDTLVQNALEVASLGPTAKIQFPSYNTFSPVDVYDQRVENTSTEEMIHLGQTLIDRVRVGYPDLVCDGNVSKSVTTVTIINSRGGEASYTKSVFSIFGHGTIVKGTDMLFVSDGASSCQPIPDVSDLVESIRLKLEHSREIAAAPSGDGVCVLFTPRGVAGALLSPLLAGFNGKTVLQGASPLVGKLGELLLDEKFSLWDDPTLPFTPGSRMCDDEGVPASGRPLIEEGVIGSFLYDLDTAARAGTESTASAHRSLNSLPEPGVSVAVVGQGEVSYQDMVGSMERGLIVDRLLGAGQSNIQGGDFKANVLLGFRVDRGEVVGRVKDTVISGNVYRTLGKLDAVEDTAHWVGGSLKTPSLASYQVSVAAKG